MAGSNRSRSGSGRGSGGSAGGEITAAQFKKASQAAKRRAINARAAARGLRSDMQTDLERAGYLHGRGVPNARTSNAYDRRAGRSYATAGAAKAFLKGSDEAAYSAARGTPVHASSMKAAMRSAAWRKNRGYVAPRSRII